MIVLSKIRKIFLLLRNGLEYRGITFVLPVLAVLIMLPALWSGLLVDDMVHRAQLIGPSGTSEQLRDLDMIPENSDRLSSAIANLYVFLPPDKTKRSIDSGFLPWWTYEGTKAGFWRPLTSLTIWLDYQLFPDSTVLMHAHSILWFAGVIFLVTIFYRKLIGPTWVAGLAAVLYLLDENYYMPVAMIAHRNSLMAIFFGLLSLLTYHKWRKHNWLPGAILTPVCMGLSVLSAEAGVGTLCYLVAYALFLDRGRWSRRILAIAPNVIVVGLWRILYSALGYGVCAGGLYLDPGSDPLRFASVVIERAPILLLGQWCFPPAFMYNFCSDSARGIYWLLAVLFLVFVLVLLVPLLRKNRLSRFWLVGMLLSAIPICATIPWDRNLIFVGIGAMGLTAQFVGGLFSRESPLPKSRLYRGPAWLLCVLILLAQVGVACMGRFTAPVFYSRFVAQSSDLVRVDSPPPRSDQDLVVMRMPTPLFSAAFTIYCDAEGRPIPKTVRILAALVPIEVTRTDERTLKLRALAGNLLKCEQREDIPIHYAYFLGDFNSLLRDKKYPMHLEQRIELPRISIEVTGVDGESLPTEAVFRFAVPLEDPSLRWVQIAPPGRHVPFEVPAIGQTVQLRGPFHQHSNGDCSKSH